MNKCTQTSENFDYTFSSACEMAVNQQKSSQEQDRAVYMLQNYAV